MRIRRARTRIALLGAVVSFGFLTILALAVRFRVRATTYEDIDEGLETLGVALASDIELRGLEDVEATTLPASVVANAIVFHLEHHSAVLFDAGGVIAQTPDLPPIPRTKRFPPLAERAEKPYTTVEPFSGHERRVRLLPLHLGGRAQGVTLAVFRSIGPADRALARLDLALLFVVLAGSAGSAVILRFAVGRALHPMEAVIEVAERTEASDLSARVASPSAGEEFARLVSVINSLLERLEVAFASQRRLLADAAHELKTPLAVIVAEAQEAARGEEPTAELLASIAATSKALAREVDDLLFLARGEIRVPETRPPVELGEIVERACGSVARAAAERGLEVVVAGAGGVVEGDADALWHLASNLIKNAVLYGPAGSTVEVRSFRDGSSVVLEVADRGPGIAEVDRQRVFERFVRLPNGRRASPEGSGLGLAIVRQVVEAHGGSVRIEGRAGGGTVVRVELPVEADRRPEGAPAVDRSHGRVD